VRRSAALLCALVLAVAGCGSDDDGGDDKKAATTPERAETAAATACPPETDQVLAEAKFSMGHDDFDGAIAALDKVGDCPRAQKREAAYRVRAAAKTLELAKKQLKLARDRGGNNASPQPAVSLARNSIRYKDTPEARQFLAEARAALARFNRKYGPKPAEDGGPPQGAGEGGPPEQP
jgi:hypothetical protein